MTFYRKERHIKKGNLTRALIVHEFCLSPQITEALYAPSYFYYNDSSTLDLSQIKMAFGI